MGNLTSTLLVLGVLFLLGLATEGVGRRTALPRVTLLLGLGIALRPLLLRFAPNLEEAAFPFVAHIALVMVGFLLGERLSLAALRRNGRLVLGISIAVALMTAAVVLIGLPLFGVPLGVAALLAGIAPATAPAATADVVHELRASGEFPETLLGIVAIDDVWGLLVFSLLLAAVEAGDGAGAVAVLSGATWELGGALGLGLALGVPLAYLTGRIEPGEPTLAEALGSVFLCAGLSLWLGVSFLLAAIALGATIASLARHHTRPFSAIESVEWPFMLLFFVFAGASLEPAALSELGALSGGYIALRVLGRLAGGWLGAALCRAPPGYRSWIGPALMPQAGVAIGMALVVNERLPELGASVLPVVMTATVVFELAGPVLTRRALLRMQPGQG